MSEGLAQCPYVATRMGFKAATLRTQGTEFTAEPPRHAGFGRKRCRENERQLEDNVEVLVLNANGVKDKNEEDKGKN